MESVIQNGELQSPIPLSVKLEPFVHQVGGHSSMLCLDESTVCKPLLLKEKKFYESLPNLLKQFCAQYRGVIHVTITEDLEGYITLSAYPPDGYISLGIPNPTKFRIRWHHDSCIEIEGGSDEVFEDDTPAVSICAFSCGKHHTERRPSHNHNPWILKCHREHLAKLMGLDSNHCPSFNSSCYLDKTSSTEFLLLENLTWRRRRPCVLDVKMGIQQYGDDAPESKKVSQSLKVDNSTSGSLGIRLCGMQVYQVTTNRYLCRNKYHGRSLNQEGLCNSLTQFFHNGARLRREILPPLLVRLDQLFNVVSQLDSFRFYTSSLLIIYDGLEESDAHGFNYLSEIPSSTTFPWQSYSAPVDDIDVRVIDFAHATHRDISTDGLVHSGPDEGFIFGLKHLIVLIKELYEQEDK